jgi:hypothetical protein
VDQQFFSEPSAFYPIYMITAKKTYISYTIMSGHLQHILLLSDVYKYWFYYSEITGEEPDIFSVNSLKVQIQVALLVCYEHLDHFHEEEEKFDNWCRIFCSDAMSVQSSVC